MIFQELTFSFDPRRVSHKFAKDSGLHLRQK